MTISVSTGLYYNKDYREILDILAASDCTSIELFLNQAFIDVPLPQIRKEVQRRKLSVSSIHLPLTFLAYARGEDEKYWINKGLSYLDALGGDVLVTHFFYKMNDQMQKNDVDHFKNIRRYASIPGKYVCTENLPVMISLGTMHQNSEKLAQYLDDHNAFITYDTTHSATYGRDILDEYRLFKQHIRNIHLSDFKDGVEHKVLGTGDLPIRRFLQELAADDYAYPVTLEYDFENSARNSIASNEEAVKRINESLSFVRETVQTPLSV